ncbi:MAG: hypothetical protein ACLP8A_15025 [Methylovirgula sp.]
MKVAALVFGLSILGLSGAAFLAAPAAEAKPGGCLKYGAAGAVAGHYAHHHAVKGFIAGCAVGMIKRHEYNKQQKMLKEHGTAGATPPAAAPDAPSKNY